MNAPAAPAERIMDRPPQAARQPAPRLGGGADFAWLVPELQMRPVAARRCVVRNPANGATLELSSGEHAVLSACEGCLPLADHAARAAERLDAPTEHRGAIEECLARCANAGLLLALPDLVASFGPATGEALPPLAGVVVRTADRPRQLARLLASALALQERTGTAYPWHVVDDSRSAENRRANRELLDEYGALSIAHHDLSLAESLESELVSAMPDLAAEIRWLLGAAHDGEVTYGRPKNFALLRFAGTRFFLLDDDVTLEPRRPALSEPGIVVAVEPEAATWYDSADAAERACAPLDVDPLAAHASWLGLPMARAWALAQREDGGVRIGNLPSGVAPCFAADARVMSTRTQLLGDPGWGTVATAQLVPGARTRRWLIAHPEAAPHALTSQNYWRGAPAQRLAPNRLQSMSTLAGLDNSRLLPPTLRAGPGEDILLSETATCIYPACWTVELPFALPHLRAARRSPLLPQDNAVLGPEHLLWDHVRASARAIIAPGAQQRMEMLGAYFVDLAATGDAELGTMLETQAAEYASRLAFGIREQLDDASLPAGWKQTLRPWLDSPLAKVDPASLRARVAPLAEVRELAQGYGRALLAWPRLWSFCRERCQ